jgi:hypothetical protein
MENIPFPNQRDVAKPCREVSTTSFGSSCSYSTRAGGDRNENLYFLFVGLPVLLLVAVLSLLGHYLVQIPRRMSQQIEIVDTRHVRTTTRLDQKRS